MQALAIAVIVGMACYALWKDRLEQDTQPTPEQREKAWRDALDYYRHN